MCFPRKPFLGHYNGTRAEWASAYSEARTLAKRSQPIPTDNLLLYKAGLILLDRNPEMDPLCRPAYHRLQIKKTMDSIIDEIVAEEGAVNGR